MKKVRLITMGMLFTIVSGACSDSKTSIASGDKVQSFEEKVTEVCDCFEKAGNDSKERPKCFQLQDKYSKQEGIDKSEFLGKTNECM